MAEPPRVTAMASHIRTLLASTRRAAPPQSSTPASPPASPHSLTHSQLPRTAPTPPIFGSTDFGSSALATVSDGAEGDPRSIADQGVGAVGEEEVRGEDGGAVAAGRRRFPQLGGDAVKAFDGERTSAASGEGLFVVIGSYGPVELNGSAIERFGASKSGAATMGPSKFSGARGSKGARLAENGGANHNAKSSSASNAKEAGETKEGADSGVGGIRVRRKGYGSGHDFIDDPPQCNEADGGSPGGMVVENADWELQIVGQAMQVADQAMQDVECAETCSVVSSDSEGTVVSVIELA